MIEIKETELANVAGAIERWQQFPASCISHHGELCCRIAREWVLAMDRSQLGAAPALTGPRWIRQKYMWGPSKWPIYWCEAVEEKTLDCGALAALAHEVFLARGLRSFPAQFILQFSSEDTRHWHQKWGEKECTVRWIADELIYHEGCAVVSRGSEIKLWDASTGWWVNPRQAGGYHGLLALRIFASPTDSLAAYTWGEHEIVPNQWQQTAGPCAEMPGPAPASFEAGA